MLCDSSKDHDERLTQNILISDSLHQAYIFSENLVYNWRVAPKYKHNNLQISSNLVRWCFFTQAGWPVETYSSIWHKPSAANPAPCHSSAVFTLTLHVPAELTQKALTFSWEFPLVPQQLHQPLQGTSSQAAGAAQSCWVLSAAPPTEPAVVSPVNSWHLKLNFCVMFFPNNCKPCLSSLGCWECCKETLKQQKKCFPLMQQKIWNILQSACHNQIILFYQWHRGFQLHEKYCSKNDIRPGGKKEGNGISPAPLLKHLNWDRPDGRKNLFLVKLGAPYKQKPDLILH